MHIAHSPILESQVLSWADEAACAAFAAQLARQPGLAQAFLTLQGPLGAGKTTFVRHLLRALGVTGRIKSPTYTVMEPYQVSGVDIAHFDFYRFNDPREWEDAGFRDVFARPGLKLAEWPDKAAGALPTPDLALHISVEESAQAASNDAQPPRVVCVQALTPAGQRLLNTFAKAA
jgi:tRNA threonylcarbamoyladenosine biosynthesis protein TsaE